MAAVCTDVDDEIVASNSFQSVGFIIISRWNEEIEVFCIVDPLVSEWVMYAEFHIHSWS